MNEFSYVVLTNNVVTQSQILIFYLTSSLKLKVCFQPFYEELLTIILNLVPSRTIYR